MNWLKREFHPAKMAALAVIIAIGVSLSYLIPGIHQVDFQVNGLKGGLAWFATTIGLFVAFAYAIGFLQGLTSGSQGAQVALKFVETAGKWPLVFTGLVIVHAIAPGLATVSGATALLLLWSLIGVGCAVDDLVNTRINAWLDAKKVAAVKKAAEQNGEPKS